MGTPVAASRGAACSSGAGAGIGGGALPGAHHRASPGAHGESLLLGQALTTLMNMLYVPPFKERGHIVTVLPCWAFSNSLASRELYPSNLLRTSIILNHRLICSLSLADEMSTCK